MFMFLIFARNIERKTGVRQFDTILSVDGKELKGLSKEHLPPLIVGMLNVNSMQISRVSKNL
jgi:hypothetical protein